MSSFPATIAVSFGPNVLGQPGKISSAGGTYASVIMYYPNGAIHGFTYGNGIVRNLTNLTSSTVGGRTSLHNYHSTKNRSLKSCLTGQVLQ